MYIRTCMQISMHANVYTSTFASTRADLAICLSVVTTLHHQISSIYLS